MSYSLATINYAGQNVPVIELHGKFYELAKVAPFLSRALAANGLMGLFYNWHENDLLLDNLSMSFDPKHFNPIQGINFDDFLTPLQYPRKLILGGANYYEHMAKDAGKPNFKKNNNIPVFFLKPPTTSLVGCGRTVRYPKQTKKFDWEIELAVVVGSHIKDLSEAECIERIAGYSIGIDLSARDLQMNPRHPWGFDLFGGKAFDDSCPLGPKFVPARYVNPSNLHLQLVVNGIIQQDAYSSDMIWSVAEQLSILSKQLTLEPGDILLTGTPAGVGMASDTYLKEGDTIEASIEGLGHLKVEII